MVVAMMPGMRGVNPRQMKQAMKRMGITTEDISGAEEVIIRTRDKEYGIKDAAVTIMEVQGQKTFRIVASARLRPDRRAGGQRRGAGVAGRDVELVMSQTGAGRVQAVKPQESGGQPAEAILKIMSS